MKMLSKNKGFALFETMLALVIIAMMIVIASHYYNRIAQLQQANKTAMDIKEIFSGAFAYKQQNNNWPQSVDNIIKDSFLPANLHTNIFGQKYTLRSNNDKQYIQLSTCVPTMDLAAKIATMLPATTTSSDCTNNEYIKVTSTVSFVANTQMNPIHIISSQNPQSLLIQKPTCNNNETASILILSPDPKEQFQAAPAENTWQIIPIGTLNVYQAIAYVYCTSNTNGNAS